MERNGIDTELLEGFIGTMREQPDGGVVRVRTRHRWDTGFAIDGACEGSVDLHRLFEIDPDVPGVRGISLTVRVSSDADDAALEELGTQSGRTSPAYGAIARPVPVSITVERAG